MSYQESEPSPSSSVIEPMLMEMELDEEGQANDVFIDAVNESLCEESLAKGDETIATATTSGSIYGGSRSSQGQERPVGRRQISTSEEERLKEVLMRKHHLIPQNQGLEKLEAYVFSNDENAVPVDAYSTASGMIQDEEFSLHLSRQTCTGSHQLELWIREVNKAIKRPPPLSIQTKQPQEENHKAAASSRSRSSPRTRSNPRAQSSPRSRIALSPASANRSDYGQAAFSPSDKASPRHKQVTSPRTKSSRRPPKSPVAPSKSSSKGRKAGNAAALQSQFFPDSTFSREDTPRINNSVLMANIEGRYMSLREDLIRDPTFDEPPPSTDDEDELLEEGKDEESEYQSPRNRRPNQTARVHSLVSGNLASTDPLRAPDFSVREHFTLGPLSTRSSGILSANSWSSSSTFDSGTTALLPGKGCGIFLCE